MSLIFEHTKEWRGKLTQPLEELDAEQCQAIAEHLLTCPDCQRIVSDFQALPWLLEALPVPRMSDTGLRGMPLALLRLWAEEDIATTIKRGQRLPIIDGLMSRDRGIKETDN